jgi:di/tricarboxylate transporter
MNFQAFLVICILAFALGLFISEKLRVDVVALGVVVALMLSSVLKPEEALAGFASTTLMSIVALFIVGGAVFQTGLANRLGDGIIRIAGTDPTRLMLVLMIATAILSAFISSTGVVALMLPAVVNVCRKTKIAPSKLLIPMAYGALFGGALTLIGTPPNIVASEALAQAGYAPFSFFSFTPLGLILLAAGAAFMWAVGRFILPERTAEQSAQRMETPEELFDMYRLPDNLYRLRVREESPLVGMTVQALAARERYSVTIVSVVHVDKPRLADLAAMTRGHAFKPEPNYTFRAEDLLIVQGKIADINQMAADYNLTMLANEPVQQGDLITNEVGIAEVILRPRASILGKTLSEIKFGTNYRLTVLNLLSAGSKEVKDIKTAPLNFGDMLLVQGRWADIFALKKKRNDFIVMGEPEAKLSGAFTRENRAVHTLVVMIVMVALIVLEVMPLVVASFLAALALILMGCITMDEAYDTIDWKSVVLIGGMIPLSTALVRVGLVDQITGGIVDALGAAGPVIIMGALFLVTVLITQMLSNTVTTVLLAPIGIAMAQQLDVSPQPLVMAVAIAASMAFATPIASPVNTLVMSAGSYRFADYIRVGLPMILITFVISLVVLPILFPF